jgi:hypothetical protein
METRLMKMHHVSPVLLVCLLMGIVPAWAEPAAAPQKMSAPVVYKDLMLIISTKEGVAVVVFGEEVENGVTYRYRFLPSEAGKEVQRGEGKVFEKHDTVVEALPNGKFSEHTEYGGGELFITAGSNKLLWSLGGRGHGWVYYQPEEMRLQMGHAREFENVDLKRFAR